MKSTPLIISGLLIPPTLDGREKGGKNMSNEIIECNDCKKLLRESKSHYYEIIHSKTETEYVQLCVWCYQKRKLQ